MNDLNVIDRFLQAFITYIDSGFGLLGPDVGFLTATLIGIDITLAGLTGVRQIAPTQTGSIAGIKLMIGEAATDADGNLFVAPGLGVARSWSEPPLPMKNFLNNPTWFDDIADGPIDAIVTFADGRKVEAEGAWVVAAPPDFAPGVQGLVTLADVMANAMGQVTGQIFFDDHILPLLARADRLRWVNERPLWTRFAKHITNGALRDPSPAVKPAREAAGNDLLRAQNTLADFRFTADQLAVIRGWVAGQFKAGSDPAVAALDRDAALDRAHLESGVGGGFFPGIEVGFLSTLPGAMSRLFRFTRESFTDHDGQPRTLEPGSITQRMACPWQADFLECEGNWWPAQRPDIIRFLEDGQPAELPWARGVAEGGLESQRQSMVDSFARLGVIVQAEVGGSLILKESGRDPEL